MNITIRYFASMRDHMGRGEDSLTLDNDTATVTDAWNQATTGQPLPESTLIAVNMGYTDANHAIKDGDEIAFFPPVTGG